MKDIELLLPRVLEKAAACPEPTAIRHLRDAAIEFCRRTRIWRESDSFSMLALTNPGSETLAPFEGSQIYEISHAAFIETGAESDDPGTPLEAVTIDWLDQEHPGWREKEGPPRFITQSAPNTVTIAPKADGTLKLELILLPAEDADQVPDILIETYSRQIADGAIGAVLLLPGDFGNADLGAFHTAKFEEHLARFGDRIPRGQQRAKRRSKTSGFF